MAIILVIFRTPKHVKPVDSSLHDVLLHLDFPGIALLTSSLVCFILAFQWGGLTKHWSDRSVISTLVIWLVLTIAFVVDQFFEGEYAMFPPRLVKKRLVWANSLFVFV
jgi:MFS transporter, DHA2 family, glioxin efflux transporter